MNKISLLLIPIALSLTGCLSTKVTSIRENAAVSSSPVSTLEVSISSSQFSPAVVSIKSDQILKITNHDSERYTLISDPHPTHDQMPSFYKILYKNDFTEVTPPQIGKFGIHIEENPSVRLELHVVD